MRLLIIFGAVLAACGGRVERTAMERDLAQESLMEVHYYREGQLVDTELTVQCRDRIEDLVVELVRGSGEELRLLVSEDRIGGIKGGDAVEVVFPERKTLQAGTMAAREIGQVLIPLSNDDYIGTPERPYVTVFTAGEGGYQTGPLFHREGLVHADAIRDCLSSN